MEDLFAVGPLDWAGLEVLSPEECEAKLAAAPIARLGFVEAGEPVILPINYTWSDHRVIFRTAAGSKLSAATMGRPVCVEIDGWNGAEHTGFSVVVKGTAEEVVDEATIAELESLHVRPWSRPDLRTHWVVVHAADVTGRAIRSGTA